MQMKNPTLAKFKVRLALSRAIDRAQLVKTVYSDAYLPATYWLVQGLPGFQGNAAFENTVGYDPEAAKAGAGGRRLPQRPGLPHPYAHDPG